MKSSPRHSKSSPVIRRGAGSHCANIFCRYLPQKQNQYQKNELHVYKDVHIIIYIYMNYIQEMARVNHASQSMTLVTSAQSLYNPGSLCIICFDDCWRMNRQLSCKSITKRQMKSFSKKQTTKKQEMLGNLAQFLQLLLNLRSYFPWPKPANNGHQGPPIWIIVKVAQLTHTSSQQVHLLSGKTHLCLLVRG